MFDAATKSQEEVPVEEQRRRKQKRSKGKGKEKEETKNRNIDVEMADEGRFSPYEDLSEYEKEEVKGEAPVTPPITKKKPVGICCARNTLPPTHGRHYTGSEENRNAGDYWSTLAPGRA
ncbi:hypothetical protein BGX38DRAFT_1264279 [Terfezia claveryi]|nr:hypothetical protein BGX38DRAFT_1264279 [Terfezia claveryi]